MGRFKDTGRAADPGNRGATNKARHLRAPPRTGTPVSVHFGRRPTPHPPRRSRGPTTAPTRPARGTRSRTGASDPETASSKPGPVPSSPSSATHNAAVRGDPAFSGLRTTTADRSNILAPRAARSSPCPRGHPRSRRGVRSAEGLFGLGRDDLDAGWGRSPVRPSRSFCLAVISGGGPPLKRVSVPEGPRCGATQRPCWTPAWRRTEVVETPCVGRGRRGGAARSPRAMPSGQAPDTPRVRGSSRCS